MLGIVGQDYDWVCFFQMSKPTVGEARQSGNSAVAAEFALSGFYVNIEHSL